MELSFKNGGKNWVCICSKLPPAMAITSFFCISFFMSSAMLSAIRVLLWVSVPSTSKAIIFLSGSIFFKTLMFDRGLFDQVRVTTDLATIADIKNHFNAQPPADLVFGNIVLFAVT